MNLPLLIQQKFKYCAPKHNATHADRNKKKNPELSAV